MKSHLFLNQVTTSHDALCNTFDAFCNRSFWGELYLSLTQEMIIMKSDFFF